MSDHCISSLYDSTGNHRRFADLPALHQFVKVSTNEDRKMSHQITIPWTFCQFQNALFHFPVPLAICPFSWTLNALVCKALHRQIFILVYQEGRLLNLELQLIWQCYTTGITCSIVPLVMYFQGNLWRLFIHQSKMIMKKMKLCNRRFERQANTSGSKWMGKDFIYCR